MAGPTHKFFIDDSGNKEFSLDGQTRASAVDELPTLCLAAYLSHPWMPV
jgi:hypothetical protein